MLEILSSEAEDQMAQTHTRALRSISILLEKASPDWERWISLLSAQYSSDIVVIRDDGTLFFESRTSQENAGETIDYRTRPDVVEARSGKVGFLWKDGHLLA